MRFHVSSRAYAHIDCNSFYASCEVLRNPSLVGKCVCVGHEIIIAASYECKKLWVKTGMAMWEAERLLCGTLIKKYPDHAWYKEVSHRLMSYLWEKLGKIEVFSIDELFADVTGLTDDYETFAEELKHTIYHDIGLRVSIGISNTRLRAKMFGEIHKPFGSFIAFDSEDVTETLAKLPLTHIPYIASWSAERLGSHIKTALDFYNLSAKKVSSILGKNWTAVWLELRWVDAWAPHDTSKKRKSIICSRSFNDAITNNPDFLWRQALSNFERAYETLLWEWQWAWIIGIYFRTKGLEQIHLGIHTAEITIDRIGLLNCLKEAFKQAFNPAKTYRTVGVILENLSPLCPKQLSVFDMKAREHQKSEKLAWAVSRLKDRFGSDIIHLWFLAKNETKKEIGVLFEVY